MHTVVEGEEEHMALYASLKQHRQQLHYVILLSFIIINACNQVWTHSERLFRVALKENRNKPKDTQNDHTLSSATENTQ